MKRIALLTETSRGYGRDFLTGVAQFAQERRDWLMRLLSPEDLGGRKPFAGFDGIISRAADAATMRKIRASGLPTADASHEETDPYLIIVGADDAAVARMAADFFLKRGFRHFAYCGFKGTRFSDNRCRSFRQRLAEAGFGMSEFTAPEPMTDAFFYSEKIDDIRPLLQMRDWVKSLPPQTAVFCANDMRAYQLMRVAAAEAIRIPQDLAVLGSDNDNLLCLFSTPPLSSIDPNAKGVGYAAARLLHAAMQHPDTPRKRHRPFTHITPGELIERASTEFYPVEPAWLSDLLVFIDRNLARPIAVTDLVALSGRSYPTVEKAFTKAFGETIGHTITRIKMTEAQRLIKLGQLSSKEIAARTGFTSPQYFCNAYRAFFGHAPFSHTRNREKR
ncbi:MAG: DNA-binding transcriptional regulator [Kiritimatiellae bacterium]|nr:DNA-binding transcriptional regulator [Kiritimatiellia bacterium]